MGCNNSHLRPLFRRCRRRSKKDDVNCSTPKRQASSQAQNNDAAIDSNHIDASPDLLHGFQFIGSSMRQNAKGGDVGSSDQPSCVPLLAQSELSHSQIEFFKMLDDKVQQGPDYDSEEERIETELLVKRNLDTWRRTIENANASWKISRVSGTSGCGSGGGASTSSGKTVGNHAPPKSNRCQWDDEGD
ncbi:uncharacterized protein LOC110858390 isoform X2 [Folsomia candida]|uniref:Uncharacterized protein n=1 Tax=Folsomia candida TaxID=158441 RepID=A0A226DGF5_FOLCA|nr:uncharacterized protein LOC110858390 isoform X2 [Folsomia candida]OXA43681.1 hypothetical protein Fcan01_21589 [Folsomia candida]